MIWQTHQAIGVGYGIKNLWFLKGIRINQQKAQKERKKMKSFEVLWWLTSRNYPCSEYKYLNTTWAKILN